MKLPTILKCDDENNKTTLKLRQSYVAMGPLILTVALGMTSGYSAILIPQLQQSSSEIEITKDDISWIASMAALPMAFGCIIGGYFMEKFGRKACHIICTVPCMTGWLVLALSTNLPMLLTGRFLTGICAGLLGSTTGVYIGETSEPKFRGLLLAMISLAVSLGLLLVHMLGTFISWRNCAYVSAFLTVISTILLIFAPESPSWLAKSGRTTECQTNFYWLRGDDASVKKELSEMIERQNHSNAIKLKEKLTSLMRPEFLRPLIIIVVFIVTNQWAGNNALTFYSVSIIRETVNSGLNEYVAMLIVDAIRLVMSVVACVVLKRNGRRPLAMISGVGTFLSLATLSIYTFLIKSNPHIDSTRFAFIPMTALATYIGFITIGLAPLPWMMIGEVFPLANRNIGSSLTSMMAFLAFFSVVKTSPSMFDELGPDGTFAIYGAVALVGTIFIYFFLPETKDKPLHEIEDEFKK